MTVAVLFQPSAQVSSAVGMYLAALVTVVLLGLGPLVSWATAAWQRPLAKRFIVAGLVALALSLTLGASTAQAFYIKCDWYDILWWLCG